ncbi:tetratricopeptide repeat-containing sensor histidine kinase [Bacteroides intestinalis]|uniref:histidine kinase n=1 Tax=Bacteroides intestinalis TaxID=329854 RepID=A0A3E4KX57_9BACE|nr:ATP-binding protein [Bacteroides intestinalis]KAA4694130.1 sensor histidine kinase [Bacteroides intestinalis]KAA4720674.1 sensor histidine kinase [Bacteroides intestinalis]QDO67708.1 sensor histidine kinase [Bacteroides intestinalis]RGK25491.1 sensor histidine kinase [Bacteroides intestinalis]RGT50565.1 sensor histidine kinase [Bacteroides intestinalis]
MRKIAIISAVTGFLLFSFAAGTHATSTDKERLTALQSLITKEVPYDANIPIDSIISWTDELAPTLKSPKTEEAYFTLVLWEVNAYIMRGDLSLAIDRARLMYEYAKDIKSNFGIALSNQAIGQAYSASNIQDKALSSYMDALRYLPENNPQTYRLLVKISTQLQQMNRLEEAMEYVEKLNPLLEQNPEHPLAIPILIENATYYISSGDQDTALQYLHQADSIYKNHTHEIAHEFSINYYTAACYRALAADYHDKEKADEALALYNQLLEVVSNNKRSLEYRWICAEKIYLYKLLGHFDEACQIYKELYSVTDTLASKSYIRQINALKATYQVDEIELENKAQQNKMVVVLIFIGLGLLTFISMLAIWLRRQKKVVVMSTETLEQLRHNAENATRAKSIFLSNMSHEIRTPLNALSGFSALLTEEGLDDSTRRQCTDIIQQNSELLLKLINDVIDLSSLEFGKMQFSIAEHDAVATCRNVTDTVGKVKQTQAELLFETSLEELYIETDDSRLQQVLINLLINATKFTPDGSITLKLEKQSEKMALFSVTDTGCGIPKEKQASIFQRFEKLDENAQGSGLGLSICQLIIEHIGGKIWIDPDYTGGSRFVFTHPIHQTRNNSKKED